MYSPTDGFNFFHWANRKNATIEQSQYQFDKLNRSDIVLNTVESDFEINLLNNQLPVE